MICSLFIRCTPGLEAEKDGLRLSGSCTECGLIYRRWDWCQKGLDVGYFGTFCPGPVSRDMPTGAGRKSVGWRGWRGCRVGLVQPLTEQRRQPERLAGA